MLLSADGQNRSGNLASLIGSIGLTRHMMQLMEQHHFVFQASKAYGEGANDIVWPKHRFSTLDGKSHAVLLREQIYMINT